ncbi:MAG: helix-turn-helix domain-containing protein [Solirubrobacteraceae bacterium]|nr:helix-turn-helix domain-containing protein [Solirubrobacteraceae bacterium]
MAEIGETLRDARMRARIDISEIEAQTKIRAKYLRAIENEEWDLLPGPTYVKSFLRTYAEALGLDARMLVEEYKLRHERLSDDQLRPIGPPGSAARGSGRRGGGPSGPPRLLIVGVIFVFLLGALAILGLTGGDDEPTGPSTSTTETDVSTTRTTQESRGTTTAKRATKPATVRLQIVPTGDVYVCLVAGPRVLVPGSVLKAGEPTEVFRSKRFRLNLGNSNAKLRINGKLRSVPTSSEATGYVITRNGRKALAAGERPDCT